MNEPILIIIVVLTALLIGINLGMLIASRATNKLIISLVEQLAQVNNSVNANTNSVAKLTDAVMRMVE